MNEITTATSSASSSASVPTATSAAVVTNSTTSTAAADSVTASVTAAGNTAAAATSTTKTATPTPTTAATSVKLLIKASNQQYDDQILDIDLLWTVKRLKGHLAQVYPNKPPVDEQKLIYSGQLLNDNLLLKDVIRSYKDVYTQNQIIHLVYTPKTSLNPNFKQKSKSNISNATAANMSPSANTNDGLRQRHVAAAGGATPGATSATTHLNNQQQYYQQYQQQQQQQPHFAYSQFNQQLLPNAHCPTYDPNNPQHAAALQYGGFPGQYNMQQQAAMFNWMQQVYSQYMEQCIRMANTSATTASGLPNFSTPSATNTAAYMPNPGVNPLGFNPFLQQMPFLAPTNAASSGVASNSPVIPTAATMLPQPVARAAAESTAVAVQAAAVEGQPQAERQAAAAPRFPNIVQEEQDNRDWLDSFFSITRLAIFLTILYLNSSPLRCLAVVIIAGGIYLYHIGVLRMRNERNNNNLNRNNNAAEADQIRRGVRQVQQAAHANEQRNDENDDRARAGADGGDDAAIGNALPNDGANTATATDGAATVTPADANENTNNTASVISIMRTFVVTFFTSLLPETPTL